LLKPYGEVENFLKSFSGNETVLLDLGTISNQMHGAIPEKNIIEGENLVARLKTIKNPVEIGHICHAMQKDGVALVRLFRWLEDALEKRPVPETEVAEKLIELRRAQGDYFGESFDAIIGYNGNGAIVHYRPERGTCADIRPEGILLLDSGGQYLDGTTDITRTVALSTPTELQKRDFTLVLKGHIALASARFPQGTTGVQLDTLARMHLWNHRLNYGHGTGHGVGFFNSVHEGPQGFSPVPNTPRANVTLEPGMLTSNEPGLYKVGEYGIRIENLVLCVEEGENEPFGKYYRFDTLSLFPIDLELVNEKMLTDDEKKWLDDYHRQVFEKISPLLNDGEKAWLVRKCEQRFGK
jgi:Xaa-Pro aminopeptidase